MSYKWVAPILLFALSALLPNTPKAVTVSQPASATDREAEDESEAIRERVRLYLDRHGDNGKIDAERHLDRVKAEYAEHRKEKADRSLSPQAVGGTTWVSIGPSNGAGRAGFLFGTRRVVG